MTTDIGKKWDEIAKKDRDPGRYRIVPDHPLNLFIGYSRTGRREFTLESKSPIFEEAENLDFENIGLEISEINEGYSLKFELNDGSLSDLFTSICLDLVSASSKSSSESGAARILINRIARWSELLKERRTRGMSLEEQIGLLGELTILQWFLENQIGSAEALIRGWRGPDGDTRDLSINQLTVEIKAQLSTSRSTLKISSLDQLDHDSRFVVIALTRFSASDTGLCLQSVINDIGGHVLSSRAIYDEFLRKLFLTGYDPDAAYITDTYNRDSCRFYHVQEDFPRLTPVNVPSAIKSAAYEIGCEEVSRYEIKEPSVMEMANG